MLTELVDIIVTFSSPELVLAFTMVSKRYSRLLVPKVGINNPNYFNYDVIGEKEFGNKLLRNYIKRAKHRSLFTTVKKNIKTLIRYSDPDFSNHSINYDKYEQHVYKYQTLKNIIAYNQSREEEEDSFFRRIAQTRTWKCLCKNPHHDVFIYACNKVIDLEIDGSCTTDFMYNNISSYDRLEYLLTNKMYFNHWGKFLTKSNDLNMYKRVYEFQSKTLVSINLNCERLFSIDPIALKWVIDTWSLDKNDFKVRNVKDLNASTLIYIYKRRFLDTFYIWKKTLEPVHKLEYNKAKLVYDNLYTFISMPSIQYMIRNNYHSNVLTFAYEINDLTPSIQDFSYDVLLTTKYDRDWILSFTNTTKKQLRWLLHLSDRVINIDIIKWLLKDIKEQEVIDIIERHQITFYQFLFKKYFVNNFPNIKMIDMIMKTNNDLMINSLKVFLKSWGY